MRGEGFSLMERSMMNGEAVAVVNAGFRPAIACDYCGAMFFPRRSTARFCSTSCRVMNNRKNRPAAPAKVVDEGELEKQIRQLKHENRQLEAQLARTKKQVSAATRCSKKSCQLHEALDEVREQSRKRTMRERRLYAALNMQDES